MSKYEKAQTVADYLNEVVKMKMPGYRVAAGQTSPGEVFITLSDDEVSLTDMLTLWDSEMDGGDPDIDACVKAMRDFAYMLNDVATELA